jgi:hypothetical protein
MLIVCAFVCIIPPVTQIDYASSHKENATEGAVKGRAVDKGRVEEGEREGVLAEVERRAEDRVVGVAGHGEVAGDDIYCWVL